MNDGVAPGPGWVQTRVTLRRTWTADLVTLRLDHVPAGFVAGQFFNLGLTIDGQLVRRAYSAASPPGAPLEFFIARVAGGSFSPALFELEVGDALWLERRAQGFFTLAYVPPACDLWCIATGTGLGPYLSMLGSGELWQRFERVVLVHGVRTAAEVAYVQELAALVKAHPSLIVVRCVSRETTSHLSGRVTEALRSGALEASVGFALDNEASHVLLCGNPSMIQDMATLLKERGMRRHRQRQPGHFSMEKYW